MRPVALSDDIAVGEMPAREEVAVLAKAGFRSMLNVQPDGEVGRLITSSDAMQAAIAAGLVYEHVPIESRRLSSEQADAFVAAMERLPRPIYACCYSGARAAAAWATAMAIKLPPAEVMAACAKAGFDTTSIQSTIERRHAGEALPAAPQPQAAMATTPTSSHAPAPAISAPAAVNAAEQIIFPRAAGPGGFAVSG